MISSTISRLRRRVVAATATLALAGGLLVSTAGSAEAANVWDRVAACESGGRWHINTGNGYYGGLQFSSSTWKGYGGKKYASQAHKASKSEQIKIAKKVLKGQGPGAWPVCSRKAGLTRSNGAAAGTSSGTKAKVVSTSSGTKAKTVTVRSGDTLAKIAARHDVRGGWKGLWKLNKAKVKNPNQIKVGMKLRIR